MKSFRLSGASWVLYCCGVTAASIYAAQWLRGDHARHQPEQRHGDVEKRLQNAEPCRNGRLDDFAPLSGRSSAPLSDGSMGVSNFIDDDADSAKRHHANDVREEPQVFVWTANGESAKPSKKGNKNPHAQRLSKVHESPASVVGQVALPAYRAEGFAFSGASRRVHGAILRAHHLSTGINSDATC